MSPTRRVILSSIVPVAAAAAADPRPASRPSVRRGHGLVYHPGRKAILLFGGGVALPEPRMSDLWALKNNTWTRIDTQGPAPRTLCGFAYDSARDRVVVFGGLGGNNNKYGDTWEWDGQRWEEKYFPARGALAGPRDHLAMAYDSKRKCMVVQGGGVYVNDVVWRRDTWEYDGTAWTQRDSSNPGTRAHHAMAYDSARGVTLLHGGIDEKGRQAGLWQWDGTAWKLLSEEGPGLRARHRMAFDAARGEMVAYGGDNGNPRPGEFAIQGDTWIWDGVRWTGRKVEGPGPRFMHAMAYDSDRKVIVLHGGTPRATEDDTWEWDGRAWKRIA